MALQIEQLIKIILGILVFVAVVVGVYFFFKDKVISFFEGFSPENATGMFMALLK